MAWWGSSYRLSAVALSQLGFNRKYGYGDAKTKAPLRKAGLVENNAYQIDLHNLMPHVLNRFTFFDQSFEAAGLPPTASFHGH